MSNIKLPDGFADSLPHIASLLGLKTQAGINALEVALENIVLLDKKNLDYGPNNINKWGTFGCVVRMSDKFERLHTLYQKKRRRPQNESLHDTFRDISNYAIISILCDTKRWPNSETTNSTPSTSPLHTTSPSKNPKSSSTETDSSTI